MPNFSPALLAALMIFSTAPILTACSNPNFCEDHVNDDCREREKGTCESSADCAGEVGEVCDLDSANEQATCVQCTADEASACGGNTPTCRGNTCNACAAHPDCDSKACLASGACVPKADLTYVLAGATATACTLESPCGKISDALKLGSRYVKLSGALFESVTVSGQTVTFLTDPGTKLSAPGGPSAPVLKVDNGSRVELLDLEITGGKTDGIHLDGASTSLSLQGVTISKHAGAGIKSTAGELRIVRSSIAGNRDLGIAAMDTALTLSRSSILLNEGGGISIDRGACELINNLIAQNGKPASLVGGITLNQTSATASKIEFNTITANSSSSGRAGMSCGNIPAKLATANNIIYDNGSGEQAGGDCSWTYSNIGSGIAGGQPASGQGNINESPAFKDVAQKDFRLQATSPARNQADPNATQDTDIEGDRRQDRRDMGADEVM